MNQQKHPDGPQSSDKGKPKTEREGRTLTADVRMPELGELGETVELGELGERDQFDPESGVDLGAPVPDPLPNQPWPSYCWRQDHMLENGKNLRDAHFNSFKRCDELDLKLDAEELPDFGGSGSE